jgi:hypothetical protein
LYHRNQVTHGASVVARCSSSRRVLWNRLRDTCTGMNAMTNIQTIESLNADIAGRERALAPVIAQRDALDAHISAETEAIRALIDQRAALQLSEMGAAPDWRS